MGSSGREQIVEVFDALDADLDRLCELSFDVFTTPERLRALERLERVARRLRAPQHASINQLAAQASEEELGATLRSALADRLRITRAEAGRRIDDAADLGERRALTGQPLAPRLTATAKAQRRRSRRARPANPSHAYRTVLRWVPRSMVPSSVATDASTTSPSRRYLGLAA
ncbi:hypothetical protein MLAC_20010 [Mycobacterium lacus]|uniref:DUF222 domain-containing protein n=1 Tax=Mycobacterium lacus TaxID=169765 RepID=A0A7I7NMF1_9MYCO|nr:DUF222 domain-containing protein [Mycobacterium lacus]BBX96707.1 hypothetical protein MLAC_20010 [Mycobacterium lacus]